MVLLELLEDTPVNDFHEQLQNAISRMWSYPAHLLLVLIVFNKKQM